MSIFSRNKDNGVRSMPLPLPQHQPQMNSPVMQERMQQNVPDFRRMDFPSEPQHKSFIRTRYEPFNGRVFTWAAFAMFMLCTVFFGAEFATALMIAAPTGFLLEAIS